MKKRYFVIIPLIVLIPFVIYATTNFPTAIDTYADKSPSDVITSAGWNNMQDAIEALETKVGADSSADSTSLDYKVKSTSSSNPGHKHTLANGATDVTASTSSLNYLGAAYTSSGVTTSDFIKLHGVTANYTEINKLTGATSTPAASKVVLADANGIVHSAELNMTGQADASHSTTASINLGTVSAGDWIQVFGDASYDTNDLPDYSYGSISADTGNTAVFVINGTVTTGLYSLTNTYINGGVYSYAGSSSFLVEVTTGGTLVLKNLLSQSGGSFSGGSASHISAFFLKKQ